MIAIIVATPLLAAIWLGSSVAEAQDTVSERTAVARSLTPAAANEPDQRGGGGSRERGAGRGSDSSRGRDAGRGPDTGRGRDVGRGAPPARPPAGPRPPNVRQRIPTFSRQYYPPAYYDRWLRQTYRWSPLAYAPWSLIYGSAGFSNYGYYSYGGSNPSYGYGYGNGYGYGYGYGQGPWGRNTTYDTGGIRFRVRPRDAQVFVNGYYAGLVDDFDGTFQELRLEQGGHKIEVRMPGFEDLLLDVHVQPNRTITIREDLRPRP